MTVVHEHGIHAAAIAFCHCPTATDSSFCPEPVQLIKFGLFPGSWQQPQTAYTINGLRDYHLLSLQSTITALDYVYYLRRSTDNDRYRELNTAMREFTFLRNVRRAGQDPTSDLPAGCLAVSCPACPQPGINMLEGWRDRPDAEGYLDMLFYSVDGNFHHNQKMKPMDPEDYPLTQGAGYFRQAILHQASEYMNPHSPFQESTCNKFGAMGYGRYSGRVSGMVGLTCSRHMFVFPRSLVDLVKGEGFAWGDFAQLSGLQPWLDVLKLFCRGYDINCQYDKKFELRLADFRSNFSHLRSVRTTVFPPTRSLIPKFHAPAHTLLCSVYRSYNYTPGVGMTDGEASERIWAAFNALAIRAKEMTAGHRHDVINDFLSDLNVRRVHGMPKALSGKHQTARRQLALAREHLQYLEQNIADERKLSEWRQTEAVWERDVLDPQKHRGLQNPYLLDKEKGLTEKQLVEMMKKMRAGREEHSLGPLGIIHQGTLLERKREELLDELELDDATDVALETLKGRCDTFLCEVDTWTTVRDAYLQPLVDKATRTGPLDPTSGPKSTSAFFPLRDMSYDAGSASKGLPPVRNPKGKPDLWQDVHAVNILLPSAYDASILRALCMREVVGFESEIRRAQARDALDDVRTAIIGREAYKIKKIHLSSKTYATRATNHIRSMEDGVREAANRYRRARTALLALGMDEADPEFRVLRKEDTVKYSLDGQHKTLGESSESKPWIWERFTFSDTQGDGQYQAFFEDARRVHWFRSSALNKRWREELSLVEEEMRRSIRFFSYHRHRWLDVAEKRDLLGNRGAAAYARKQAHRYARLLHVCQAEYTGRIDLVRCAYPTQLIRPNLYLSRTNHHYKLCCETSDMVQ
ncbi:hypothetical protein PYCCODRAFT_1375432 [Trametes coccinea BRFM310]|uniref:CxC2-like cysteine cluster KDZ transposase-associated domain-containing protein n=1 Tax=Trametes coccinea (strain BRFM310) TaxID=1353009 RepID=A0A1Y2IB05_TRAC3|nr:hypothetical protein PYCCODRAFT_1375432 [Trametes coccinea BRFM310]